MGIDAQWLRAETPVARRVVSVPRLSLADWRGVQAKEGFEEVRRVQATNLCDHLRSTNAENALCFVVGDFNDTPGSLCASVMQVALGSCLPVCR